MIIMAKMRYAGAVVDKSAAAFVMGRRWQYAKETETTMLLSGLS